MFVLTLCCLSGMASVQADSVLIDSPLDEQRPHWLLLQDSADYGSIGLPNLIDKRLEKLEVRHLATTFVDILAFTIYLTCATTAGGAAALIP